MQIVSVGPEVPTEYAVGKRVCVENHFYCGHCYQCTHGKMMVLLNNIVPCQLQVYRDYV